MFLSIIACESALNLLNLHENKSLRLKTKIITNRFYMVGPRSAGK